MITLLLACGGPAPDTAAPIDDSTAPVDSVLDSEAHEEPTCGEVTEPEVEPTLPALSMVSSFTWTLEFDGTAEAAGLWDCSYTRSWEGLEFVDQPYLCPDCSHMAAGQATMEEGADCFAQISSADADRAEWWGFGDAGFYRTAGENLPLGELPVTSSETYDGGAQFDFENTYDLTDGGVVELSATGTMSWEDSGTLLPDYWAERQTDYAGGWPRDDPGDLVASEVLELGSTFPNVRLYDQCDDLVELWDFHGTWLVIDHSAFNCGPCIAMAQDFGGLQAELAAEGVDVQMVTLMGGPLSEWWTTPSSADVNSWVDDYGWHGPVLRDRGFAYATFDGDLEDVTGESYGFPAWVLVDPEMKVVMGRIGYGDSSYEDVKAAILGD